MDFQQDEQQFSDSINLFFNELIEMLKVLRSISIKSIFAPQCRAQLADATNEFVLVQTISFFFIPIDKHATCNAELAELNVRA